MMSTKQGFSTSALNGESQRLAAWQDIMWRVSGGMAVEPLPPAPFRAAVEYGRVGQATLCRVETGPHRAVHRADPGDAGRPGTLNLLFTLEGGMRIEHAGRQAMLGPGSWALWDTGRACSLVVDRSVTQLLMAVPKDMLGTHQRDMLRLNWKTFPMEAGPGKVVRQVVGSLFDELESLKPATAAELTALTLELAHMAVQDNVRRDATSSVREMLHERMSGFIRRNLRDPGLSVDSIANAFACSKRYVHKIFSGESQTVGEMILGSRLDRCRRDLADSTLADESITGIAFGWGFSNCAYFSRVFRERYGVTPSAYRARHIQPAMRSTR